MKWPAYAKINLGLNVVRKRDDGYHELEMIMAPINFYDIVDIEFSKEMIFESNARYLPSDKRNTMIKAIEIMRENYHFKENFHIKLTKHIPSQAGLAGGSADAAATMKIVERLLDLNIEQSKMIEMAKQVGADVPFCLMNQPALVKGIGEKLEFFDIKSDFYLFLAKPYQGVSTKEAFSKIDFDTIIHPDINGIREDLENDYYYHLIKKLGNSLEDSAFEIVPEIRELKEALLEYGFDGALMSGSGSCVFAITRDKHLFEQAGSEFKKRGYFVRNTAILKKNV